MIDHHVHIERGEYSINWILEFVKYALERGVSELYLLEHSHRFKEFEKVYKSICDYNEYQRKWLSTKMALTIKDYIELIKRVRLLDLPVKIKFGLEVCYIEGTEDIVRRILESFDWDFVTGSVHWIDGWGFDHKKEHWEGKDIDLIYERYYSIMANLIKTKIFNIVAHPDSIKCFGHLPSYDLSAVYQTIAELMSANGISAEQSAGLYINFGVSELGLNDNLYRVLKENNVNLLTASDAHRPEDVGRYLAELKV